MSQGAVVLRPPTNYSQAQTHHDGAHVPGQWYAGGAGQAANSNSAAILHVQGKAMQSKRFRCVKTLTESGSCSSAGLILTDLEKLQMFFPFIEEGELQVILSEHKEDCGKAFEHISRNFDSKSKQRIPTRAPTDQSSLTKVANNPKKRMRDQQTQDVQMDSPSCYDQPSQVHTQASEQPAQLMPMPRAQTVAPAHVQLATQEQQPAQLSLEESLIQIAVPAIIGAGSPDHVATILQQLLSKHKEEVLKASREECEAENSILKKGIRIQNRKLKDLLADNLQLEELRVEVGKQYQENKMLKEQTHRLVCALRDAQEKTQYPQSMSSIHGGNGNRFGGGGPTSAN
ncbi:hypothetical protein FGO68_gene17131 [Halteria grandinella]|uniref:CUE domain-containing protein n=1 Tax=Halteria grandinella TaxID=5974 RepID=A0A8J8NT38_HALGN|nr:hypothetical protein FGO68_gene17131 [Halteria grandinella]